MFEIILLLVTLFPLVALAKRRPRRRAKVNWVVSRVNMSLGLGTLADNTALKAALCSLGPGSYRCHWTHFEGFISIDGLTVGQGPIVVGVALDDYTVTEIKECLEADPTGTDLIEAEKSRRKVREWGIFVGANAQEWLNNDATMRKHRIKFTDEGGSSPDLFAYNDSGAALTTGATIVVNGKLYGIKL